MTNLEIIDRELTRIWETLEKIASQEIIDLIHEKDLREYEQRNILEVSYGNR